jgi:hypothetical protein
MPPPWRLSPAAVLVGEAFAILSGQVLGAGDEVLDSVLVDELQHTAGPCRESRCRRSSRRWHPPSTSTPLLHTAHGFDGLDEQQPIAHILGRNLPVGLFKAGFQFWPQVLLPTAGYS